MQLRHSWAARWFTARKSLFKPQMRGEYTSSSNMRLFLKQSVLSFISIFFLASVGAAQEQKRESVYTSLRTKDCKENKSELENGLVYLATCKGVGGYSIVSLATEHSASINLIAPDGNNVDLDLRSQIPSAAPSGLGEKAEWRVVRDGKTIVPKALIVRVNIFSDPGNSQKATSYLVVIKISNLSSCVVGVIEPSKGQNTAARTKADAAATLPCMTPNT